MEYIINPWLIYFINICNGIKVVAGMAMFAALLIFSVSFAVNFIEDDEDSKKTIKQVMKIGLFILLFALIIVVFIPSKKAMYEIMFFKMATRQNLAAMGGLTKETFDYIIESIKELVI